MPVMTYDHRNQRLSEGDHVFLRLGGEEVWRHAKVVAVLAGANEPGLRQRAQEITREARARTGTTLDIGAVYLQNAAQQGGDAENPGGGAAGYQFEYLEYPYGRVTLGDAELRQNRHDIAYERYGKLVKFGIGTLTTSVVDCISFITALEAVFNEYLGSEADKAKAKAVLYAIAAVWGVTVVFVGGRQCYIAKNDWRYRRVYETATLSTTGALNLLSAIAAFAGAVLVLRDPEAELEGWQDMLTLRAAAGLWSVTQVIDLCLAAKALYDWKQSGGSNLAAAPEVAKAVKTLITIVGGALVTTTAGMPAVVGSIMAATGSLAGGVAIHCLTRKAKQD